MNINELIEREKQYRIQQAAGATTGFIYFICDEKSEIVYIGKTKYLYSRLAYHSSRMDLKCDYFYYFEVSMGKIDEEEKRLINAIKPIYNIQNKIAPSMEMPLKDKTVKQKNKNKITNQREIKYKINAKELKKIMKENKITQVMVATALGVTRQNISAHIGSGYVPKSIFRAINDTRKPPVLICNQTQGGGHETRGNL